MVALEEIEGNDMEIIQKRVRILICKITFRKKGRLKTDFAKIQEAEQSGEQGKIEELLAEFSS